VLTHILRYVFIASASPNAIQGIPSFDHHRHAKHVLNTNTLSLFSYQKLTHRGAVQVHPPQNMLTHPKNPRLGGQVIDRTISVLAWASQLVGILPPLHRCHACDSAENSEYKYSWDVYSPFPYLSETIQSLYFLPIPSLSAFTPLGSPFFLIYLKICFSAHGLRVALVEYPLYPWLHYVLGFYQVKPVT
jgi:hypothetical protein